MISTLIKKKLLLLFLLGINCQLDGKQASQNSMASSVRKGLQRPNNSWIQPASYFMQDTSEVEFEELEFESPYDEPLETERHDFTQSTKVVGPGVVQMEYGFLFTSNRDGGERETSYSAPELLLRFGLTETTEVRARGKYGWKFPEAEENGSGLTDMVFSIKHILSETEPWSLRPASAVEWRLSAPTGSKDFSAQKWYGGFDLIYEWELGDRITFAGSTGGNINGLGEFALYNIDVTRDDRFIAWTSSMALGAEISEKSTGYFEWFGVFTHGREEERSLNFLNVGVDYLLSKNALLDVRVGWGLNEQSDDLFAGVGGAFRF